MAQVTQIAQNTRQNTQIPNLPKFKTIKELKTEYERDIKTYTSAKYKVLTQEDIIKKISSIINEVRLKSTTRRSNL